MNDNDYWSISDAVISALDHPIENKRDDHLVEDYKKLKNVSYDENVFLKQFVSFSFMPAVIAFISTLLIGLIRPEYITYIIEQLQLGINLDERILAILLSGTNFFLTLTSLTNIVNIRINKNLKNNFSGKKLSSRHLDNLEQNLKHHNSEEGGLISNNNFINDIVGSYAIFSMSRNNSLVWRNLKREPVGTNIMYPFVLKLYEKEIERRGIFI